jgi:hypothetical protein
LSENSGKRNRIFREENSENLELFSPLSHPNPHSSWVGEKIQRQFPTFRYVFEKILGQAQSLRQWLCF